MIQGMIRYIDNPLQENFITTNTNIPLNAYNAD